MGRRRKLFPLFAATLRGRKTSRIGRAVPVYNLFYSKPTWPPFSGGAAAAAGPDWIGSALGRQCSALGIFTAPPIQSNWIQTGWLFEWKPLVTPCCCWRTKEKWTSHRVKPPHLQLFMFTWINIRSLDSHRVGSRKNSLSAVVGVVGDDKCAASTVRYLNQYNDRLEDASCPIDWEISI